MSVIRNHFQKKMSLLFEHDLGRLKLISQIFVLRIQVLSLILPITFVSYTLFMDVIV